VSIFSETEVVGAFGSLGFACCQRLGCHLDNTCIQNVAWILADFQKFVNNAFWFIFVQRRNKCWEVKVMETGWSGGVERKI